VTVGELLGTDEFGTWLSIGVQDTMANQAVSCVPSDEWWMAHWIFDQTGREHKVYVDIGTPSVWATPTEVVFVDLEMDVERLSGQTSLLDGEEFLLRAEAVPYPVDVVERASRAAEELLTAVRDGVEPFGNVGRQWFTRAICKRTAK
jgi:predicted RNA-binding protein associated with RNAse of E/G family